MLWLWRAFKKKKKLNIITFHNIIFAQWPHFTVIVLCFVKLGLASKARFPNCQSIVVAKLTFTHTNTQTCTQPPKSRQAVLYEFVCFLCENPYKEHNERGARLNRIQTNYLLKTDFWGCPTHKRGTFYPPLLSILPQCSTGDSSLSSRVAVWKAEHGRGLMGWPR